MPMARSPRALARDFGLTPRGRWRARPDSPRRQRHASTMLSPLGVHVSTRKVKCVRVFIVARLRALLDQQPPPLILVQVKLLNGHSLSPLAIQRFSSLLLLMTGCFLLPF